MKKQGNSIHIFKKHVTKPHIIQSAIAGLYIFFVFWALNSLHSEIAVSSLGASAFIAFGFPNTKSSGIRYLIGGYCIGAIIGFLCFGLTFLLNNSLPLPNYIPACAFAVFLSMLLMTILDFEHPPSAALAVAITVSANPFILGFTGLACVMVLCIIKTALKRYLYNL